jgi:hypothetical protein
MSFPRDQFPFVLQNIPAFLVARELSRGQDQQREGVPSFSTCVSRRRFVPVPQSSSSCPESLILGHVPNGRLAKAFVSETPTTLGQMSYYRRDLSDHLGVHVFPKLPGNKRPLRIGMNDQQVLVRRANPA